MKHFSWEQICSYALGEFSSDELKRHLADCASCNAEFERAKRVIDALKQTSELDSVKASFIIRASWDSRRTRKARRLEFRPSFALVPLAIVFVIVVSLWLFVQNLDSRGKVEVSIQPTILDYAKLAAKELGLDSVEVDFALLETNEADIKLEDIGVELPDESMLPALTSSYLHEVLEVDNTDELLKELGVKDVKGQTGLGRLT